MRNFHLDFGFFCDDARKEDNGKLIFIGVYGRDIMPTAMPANFFLCLVLHLTSTVETKFPMNFRFKLGDEILTQGTAGVQLNVGQNFAVFPSIPIFTSKPGIFSAEAQFGDDVWESVTSIPIVMNPSSIASLQPPSQSPPAAPAS